ncbi:MAG TPA: Sensor protein DivL [Hyphomicrobiaceae bacterium MAG_BT-2024]
MQTSDQHSTARHALWGFFALATISLSCIVVLTIAVPNSTLYESADLSITHLFGLFLVSIFAVSLVAIFNQTYAKNRKVISCLRHEASELKRNVLTAEAIYRAEPQVLIFWDHDNGMRLITHTLTEIDGLPQDLPTLTKFGSWLDRTSAEDFKEALDYLFAEGRSFTIYLELASGISIEADGRATGARAVLRLRDVAGTKRDLASILERYRCLSSEVRANRALLNALPIPVWLKDETGRIKWANEAYASAVEATDITEIFDRQIELLESRQRSRLERTIDQGNIFTERLHIISGGERKAHDVYAVNAERMQVAAAIDIADLEIARGELNRQLEAFDRTLDRVATPVAIFGHDKKLAFYNRAYQQLWTLDPEWLDKAPSDAEILDRLKELSLLPAIADYRAWKAKLLSVYFSVNTFEDSWQLPDGRILQVVANQRSDGGVTYIYEDISEKLALESRYNKLIQVQSETLDSLKEGVAVFATDGRLKLFNKAFLAIWRIPRRKMQQGPHVEEVVELMRHLFDETTLWLRIQESITAITYERAPLAGQMLRRDDSVIDYSMTPLPDGGTLITFSDVTKSRAYERALVERNEALIAADQLKSQFIGHVSYELRTPLTNIIGFSELLGNSKFGLLSAKQQEYLVDIKASSQTLLSIIDDILDLATINAGDLDLNLTPVKIQPIIDDAVLGVKERAKRQRLTMEISLADEVDKFIADEARLRQLLFNLLSNAVGFSDVNGTVRLACWYENDNVIFSIEDDGVGIPYEKQTQVFERFEAFSRGSHHRGAGLGLSIAKSLVDLHGGQIMLKSKPEVGTVVTICLPRRTQTESTSTTTSIGSKSLA